MLLIKDYLKIIKTSNNNNNSQLNKKKSKEELGQIKIIEIIHVDVAKVIYHILLYILISNKNMKK
jgi:hypothetical protein